MLLYLGHCAELRSALVSASYLYKLMRKFKVSQIPPIMQELLENNFFGFVDYEII